MNGEFLNNLYMLGGLFVALTTVVWLFTAANRRDTQKLADDLKEVKGDIKEVKGDLKGVRTDLGRDIRRVSKDVRRVDKRLSGEIGKTNRQARKTRKAVWWLRVDMQVVKDRLNIGTGSRPVAPAPFASHPEATSSAPSDPVAVDPVPDSVVPAPVASEPEPAPSEMSDPAAGDLGDSGAVASGPGSVVSAPAADIPEADVGSEAVARRPGRAGVGPSGIPAPLAAEK